MRKAIVIVTALILSDSVLANGCSPASLSSEALRIIKPYVRELTTANQEEFTDDGTFKSGSPHRKKSDEMLYKILANRTPAGDQAVAYLLNVYVGEHNGTELVCEVVYRGKRMSPLVKAYSHCPPLIGLEPFHKSVKGSGFLPKDALDRLEKGQKCRR